MLHSLPFLAGLVAGAALVGALRGERTRSVMNDAGVRLRGACDEAQRGARAAARSGFDLFRGGAKPEAQPETSAAPPEAAQPAAPAAPAAKPARKTAAARKPAAAKTVGAPAEAAKPKRAPRKPKPAEA